MPDPSSLIGPCVACMSSKVPALPIPEFDPLWPGNQTWPTTIPGLTGVPGVPAFPFPAIMPPPAPSFTFPDISMPGMPAFMLAAFESLFAGINYVLGFIPPDPENLPEIPDISMFIDAFMAAMAGKMPTIPAFSISVMGATVSIPQTAGYPMPGFPPPPPIPEPPIPPPDIPTLFPIVKLITLCVSAPFLLIKGIVESIMALSLAVPTLEEIAALIGDIGEDLGIPSVPTVDIPYPAMPMFAECMAKGISDGLSVVG